ncbi:type II toxin-antitoxin system HicB family antitoxin [Pantoea agglomerans]|uniref:type II toxin-antitoxin system HicB family antitoxin n=1 Tax=Enterobacter agglomerans TaxID=549 RepID=UPI00241371E0|nr:type II toxin-antitoxin system HicB family antitoxin [Pantoea agglomerans]
MRYPIYSHQTNDGSFSGFVPDVEGCHFADDTTDQAMADAIFSLDNYFECMSEMGSAPAEAKTIISHIDDEDCTAGSWAYAHIDLIKYDGCLIKLNITLPQFLLSRIDEYVNTHREYHSRSMFLAELARLELTKHLQ